MEDSSKKEASNKPPPIPRADTEGLGRFEKDMKNTLIRLGSFKAHSESTSSIQPPKDTEKYDAHSLTSSDTKKNYATTPSVGNDAIETKEMTPQILRPPPQKSLLSIFKPGDGPTPTISAPIPTIPTIEDKKETVSVLVPLEVKGGISIYYNLLLSD
jgi:hypothetical protein